MPFGVEVGAGRGRGCAKDLRGSLFRKGGAIAGAVLLATPVEAQEEGRTMRPTADDTRIERSGRVELPAAVLRDPKGDGALLIVGDGITVELAGELRGAEAGEKPHAFAGVGIRVTGRNVTLRGARVSGFKVGVHALGADGLVLEDCDVSGNFRQRLKSTKAKEADEDWLNPHANDGHEWFTNYGAGIYIERANGVTVRRCRARAGQNGLVLDRIERAEVCDNDFSFLSGWGIALWRSSVNVLAHNACDFCIRGYSHGVYNRGQDSARLLLFEQCSRNLIAENSATHCGDGLFAFAGQEALGSTPPPSADFDYARRGCNDNTIVGNDLSYAAAHGLEITFSFANLIYANTLVGNSICGVWAGYSSVTDIRDNAIRENGSAGVGLERGGINIEHGFGNLVLGNHFVRNACGVHLWWDADEQLFSLPWARANEHRSLRNIIASNQFEGDELAIQLRDCDETWLKDNEMRDVRQELDITGTAPERLDGLLAPPGIADYVLPGNARPVEIGRASCRERVEIWVAAVV